ncbi:hypothetical protein RINTHH_11550 [Richelia intracellularis HH01]|uniref:Uncharacterized protein n=1 Tax=Richelia intracellularis HH01 TaxID=1165094 RepID=M1X2S0_9NOST|nr:hypothetical protein RINTHH_11550 [Richelia intracellularis HH01]
MGGLALKEKKLQATGCIIPQKIIFYLEIKYLINHTNPGFHVLFKRGRKE